MYWLSRMKKYKRWHSILITWIDFFFNSTYAKPNPYQAIPNWNTLIEFWVMGGGWWWWSTWFYCQPKPFPSWIWTGILWHGTLALTIPFCLIRLDQLTFNFLHDSISAVHNGGNWGVTYVRFSTALWARMNPSYSKQTSTKEQGWVATLIVF